MHASPSSRIAPLALPATLAACILLAGCGGAHRRAAASLAPLPSSVAASTPASAPARVPSRFDRLVVQVLRPASLLVRPGGRVLARVGPTTMFGSLAVLPVVRRRPGWYGVLAPQLPNGQVGWISTRARLRELVTDFSIDASLSRREVVVRRDGRVFARFPVAIGAPATPTPTGRFAVTDKLLTQGAGSPYGCCIVALSARQLHTPQGWGGGDRIAIHATDKPGTIGSAASFGCLRAPDAAMRRIVRALPLGTLVTIRA